MLMLMISCTRLSAGMRFTTLASLLRRLQRHVADQSDFMILSSVLVGILSTIDSPDAMSNVVDRIAECVAPLSQAEDAGGDSTGSLLMRKSLLGLFVRKFLLAVNRLLFDGISRLYDDVVRYVEQFREEEGQVRDEELEAEGDRGDDSSSDALSGDSDEAEQGSMEMDIEASPQSRSSSGQSSEFLWKAAANDSLLLSPIPTRVSAVHSTVFTPIERSSSPSSAASPPPKVSSELSFPSVATGPHDSSMWSHDQMNYILSDMMRTIERDRSMNGNMRADDDPFNAQLRQVTETEKVNPSVLFVKYLDFLNRRDYQGALDSLHQYHDIALSTAKRFPQPGSTTAEAGGNTNGSASSASGSNGMHFQGTGIQYAALNLAGLQIVFDHYQAAYESIQEAIRVAQHHGDHVCVAFALSWLIRVYLKLGKPKEQVLGLLESCIDQAKELRIASLQILASLTHIESDLLRGSSNDPSGSSQHAARHLPLVYAAQTPSPRPLHIWDRLHETMQAVNTMSSATQLSSARGMTGNRGLQGNMNPQLAAAHQGNANHQAEHAESGMRWIKSVDGILDCVWNLSGKLSLSSAVGWQVFGHRTLGNVFDRVHFICFQDTATACDIALSVCNLAAYQLGEESAGGSNIYARGLHFLADTIDASTSGELIYQVPIQRKMHHLLYLWALRSGQIERAKLHADHLLDLSSAHKDLPAHIEALLARAALWWRVGDASKSLDSLGELEKTCEDHGMAFLLAQVLVVTAQVLHSAASLEAPFSSLNAALKAAQLCEQHQYDLLLAEAHLVIADIYVSMGKMEDAETLVEEQMPLVMEQGDVNLRGEGLLMLAKIALARNSQTMAGSVIDNTDRALDLLHQSAAMFSASQNIKRLKEISYLKAIVFDHLSIQHHQLGESNQNKYTQERESAALEFMKLEKRLEMAKLNSVEPFFDFELTDSIRRVISHRLAEEE